MENLVDARGLACPQPVVLTRKALLEPGTRRVVVLVDSQVSVENIQRMARSQGWNAAIQVGEGDDVRMTLTPVGGAAMGADDVSPGPTESEADANVRGQIGASPEATLAERQWHPSVPPAAAPRVVVLVASDLFGIGDEPLGRVLVRAFVKTLREIQPLPQRLIFVNAGVRLTTEGSDLLADLAALAEAGVEVVSCGTCLDYYELADRLRVGTVTNMYDIVSSLAAADRVIRP
jgi:selenium metabolism protein YedF